MSPFRQNAAPSRRLFLLFCAVLLLLPTILQAQAKPENPPAYDLKAHYTSMNSASPCAMASSSSPPFTCRRTPRTRISSSSNRTPYGIDPVRPRIATANRWGPAKLRARWIHLRVSGCPRALSLRRRFRRSHAAQGKQKSAKDVDESTDCYDTIEWLLHNVPNTTAKPASSGFPYDGFYTAASIINSHPALKAASPQAPVTDLYWAMTPITTARSCWRPI